MTLISLSMRGQKARQIRKTGWFWQVRQTLNVRERNSLFALVDRLVKTHLEEDEKRERR